MYLGHGLGKVMGFAFHYQPQKTQLENQFAFMDELCPAADAGGTHTLRFFLVSCGSLGADVVARQWRSVRNTSAGDMRLQMRLFGSSTGATAINSSTNEVSKIPRTVLLSHHMAVATLIGYLKKFGPDNFVNACFLR